MAVRAEVDAVVVRFVIRFSPIAPIAPIEHGVEHGVVAELAMSLRNTVVCG